MLASFALRWSLSHGSFAHKVIWWSDFMVKPREISSPLFKLASVKLTEYNFLNLQLVEGSLIRAIRAG